MKTGTKSVLFGYHAFWLHGWFVAAAWWKLYGVPLDPRLWVAFFIHDIGYLGVELMDGDDGELHPILGASIMGWLFGEKWRKFSLYHSRTMARIDNENVSQLCIADKLATSYYPTWFYMLVTMASGELEQYVENDRKIHGLDLTDREYVEMLKGKCQEWSESNKTRYCAYA